MLKKLFGLVALLICVLQLNLSADIPFIGNCCWDEMFCDVGGMNYLGLDTGYRYDKVSNRAVVYGHETAVYSATQEQDAVNSYILGLKGQYEWHRIVLKGFYHYGWVGGGHYHEEGLHGKLHGRLHDGSIAIGYAIPSDCCWMTVWYAGWSYDGLNTDANLRLHCNENTNHFGKDRVHTRYRGPWVGTDVIFTPCCNFKLTLSEEIHYGRWNGESRFSHEPGDDFGAIVGFSNRRSHHHMWANVFRLEGLYDFCDCWQLGLNLDYTVRASSGHGRICWSHRNEDTVRYSTKQVIDAKWTTFAATATIAYAF